MNENKKIREDEAIRIKQELINAAKAARALRRREWEPRDTELIRDAIRLHGVGAWDVIAASKRYERLWCFNALELKAKWNMLEKNRMISMTHAPSHLPAQKSLSLPSLELRRSFASKRTESSKVASKHDAEPPVLMTETERVRFVLCASA